MTDPGVVGFAEATECVRTHARALAAPRTESVELNLSTGRVLASDICTDRDMPAFARSTRDGFAVAAASGNGTYTLVGELRAGEQWRGTPLASGQCISIMTGAALPDGALAVVMVEHTEASGGVVRLSAGRIIAEGENVVPAGAEARSGDILVAAGTRMQPAHVGVAASCGRSIVSVYRKPSVAILATGDELVGIDSSPGPVQIRNSNTYALAAAVTEAGGHPVLLAPAKDTVESLVQQLSAAFEQDLVVVAGGVSAGKYDLAEQVLEQTFAAKFQFTSVRMQPGRPVVFGVARQRYFFGLPGNPVSALVTFGLLARPMLSALSGAIWSPKFATATLQEQVTVRPGLTRFLPARIAYSLSGARVRVVPWQGSGDIAALSQANGFLVIPEDCGEIGAGDTATVWIPD